MNCRQRSNEKGLEDIKKLITAEEMKSLNHSKVVPRAVSLIDQYSSSLREPKMGVASEYPTISKRPPVII